MDKESFCIDKLDTMSHEFKMRYEITIRCQCKMNSKKVSGVFLNWKTAGSTELRYYHFVL